MTPGDTVAQLYPRHWVPILVVFYDMNGLQWDYSLIPVTTWEMETIYSTETLPSAYKYMRRYNSTDEHRPDDGGGMNL
jgi:hypothetical protein